MKRLLVLNLAIIMFLTFQSFGQESTEKHNEPIKPALLVIDIQNAYLPMMSQDKDMAMYFINELIDLFHRNNYPVIRIYHTSPADGVAPGSEYFEFPETVRIKDTDVKVIKTYGDGFNKTELDKVIKETGSNTLFLCGLSSVGCVLATWQGARNHDYNAYMIKNAIISHNEQYTRNIEAMFDAVPFDMVKLIVESTQNTQSKYQKIFESDKL